LLVDQAGWHISERLAVPENITIVKLPAKCPELNPVENIWQFLRNNWLSNRVFRSYHAIVDHCCDAWAATPGLRRLGCDAWAATPGTGWQTNPGASSLSGYTIGQRVTHREVLV